MVFSSVISKPYWLIRKDNIGLSLAALPLFHLPSAHLPPYQAAVAPRAAQPTGPDKIPAPTRATVPTATAPRPSIVKVPLPAKEAAVVAAPIARPVLSTSVTASPFSSITGLPFSSSLGVPLMALCII